MHAYRVLRPIDLPPTEEIRAKLAEAEEHWRSTSPEQRQPWQEHRGRTAKWHLELAERRDAAAHPRPEGCFCLGMGGTGEEFLKRVKRFVLMNHCSCPEGQAALEADGEIRRAERIDEYDELAEHFTDSLPAKFMGCTLDTYPQDTAAQKTVIKHLNEWIDHLNTASDDVKEWLLLYGPYGTGKSSLATATAAEVIRSCLERRAIFMAVPSLLDRIRHTFKKGSDEDESDVMEELFDVPLLILDDLGSERATDWALERLFVVLNHRYEHLKTTIITSNLAPTEMGAHLGERTMWRIAEMATTVSLEACPNLRAKKAKRPSLEAVA